MVVVDVDGYCVGVVVFVCVGCYIWGFVVVVWF